MTHFLKKKIISILLSIQLYRYSTLTIYYLTKFIKQVLTLKVFKDNLFTNDLFRRKALINFSS